MATNPLNARLTKMLAEARTLAANRRRRVRARECRDLEWPDLLRLVWEAADDEGRPLLEEIAAQVKEYDSQPPPVRPEWQTEESFLADEDSEVLPHGFVRWLHMLREGHASLPEELPASVLVAWRDGYRDHPCNVLFGDHPGERSTPIVGMRCEACGMALPGRLDVCPVCGGDKMGFLNLGWMKEGDPAFLPWRKRRQG